MIGGIYINQVGIQAVLKHLDNAFGFVLAHQAVIDVNTDQLLADGLNEQRSNYRRVNTAGQS